MKNTKHTAFLGNLPTSLKEEDIKKHFKNIVGIRLMTTKEGKSKGFAYVDFKNEEELEKAIAEKRKVKIGYTENQYNGMPQYNIKSVDGKERSGFQKGKGFQRDTVSIERQASAKIAFDLIQFVSADELKDPVKKWEEFANKVYTWISARPSEPQASGGQTDQKIDLNDIPPEFR